MSRLPIRLEGGHRSRVCMLVYMSLYAYTMIQKKYQGQFSEMFGHSELMNNAVNSCINIIFAQINETF